MNKEETCSSIVLILQSDIAKIMDGINEELGRKEKKRNWKDTCKAEKVSSVPKINLSKSQRRKGNDQSQAERPAPVQETVIYK